MPGSRRNVRNSSPCLFSWIIQTRKMIIFLDDHRGKPNNDRKSNQYWYKSVRFCYLFICCMFHHEFPSYSWVDWLIATVSSEGIGHPNLWSSHFTSMIRKEMGRTDPKEWQQRLFVPIQDHRVSAHRFALSVEASKQQGHYQHRLRKTDRQREIHKESHFYKHTT